MGWFLDGVCSSGFSLLFHASKDVQYTTHLFSVHSDSPPRLEIDNKLCGNENRDSDHSSPKHTTNYL